MYNGSIPHDLEYLYQCIPDSLTLPHFWAVSNTTYILPATEAIGQQHWRTQIHTHSLPLALSHLSQEKKYNCNYSSGRRTRTHEITGPTSTVLVSSSCPSNFELYHQWCILTHDDLLTQTNWFLCLGDQRDHTSRHKRTASIQSYSAGYKRGVAVFLRRVFRPFHLPPFLSLFISPLSLLPKCTNQTIT